MRAKCLHSLLLPLNVMFQQLMSTFGVHVTYYFSFNSLFIDLFFIIIVFSVRLLPEFGDCIFSQLFVLITYLTNSYEQFFKSSKFPATCLLLSKLNCQYFVVFFSEFKLHNLDFISILVLSVDPRELSIHLGQLHYLVLSWMALNGPYSADLPLRNCSLTRCFCCHGNSCTWRWIRFPQCDVKRFGRSPGACRTSKLFLSGDPLHLRTFHLQL